MDKIKYDFGGWATKHNIKCSDGRTIKEGAFKGNHGQKVPLVWNHDHKQPDNVLGHAILEYRPEGVYAYGLFNQTEEGKRAKELVTHGDITALSIYANKLKQNGGDVSHGQIREVSLVLAGANPGAYIETVIAHSDDADEEAMIFNPSESLEIMHSDDPDVKPVSQQDPKDPNKDIKHSTKDSETKMEETKMEEKKVAVATSDSDKTVQEVFDTFTDEQKNVVYALIGMAIEENGGNQEMKQNAFDKQTKDEDVLTHAEFSDIIADAKKSGSVKDAFIAHGIENVDVLFPEVRSVNTVPETISRDMNWVQKVMNSVKKSPFSRIKSTAIDITKDEARAKGYVKGKQKVEEVVSALKRVTTPQTIYKKQAMDRDDVLDITDFDVIAYLKKEMRVMLDEEIARAILIGDQRASDDQDKIKPDFIRPIWGDNEVYTVKKILEKGTMDDYAFAKAFIKEVVKSRKDYKGSGNPVLYTTEDMLTNMLLIEDTTGRVIYDSIEKLKTALRVSDIVTVPVMEGVKKTDEDENYDYAPLGILVNLADYNVGADKGGSVQFFEDFDIDYNKEKYLIETRCSGALIKPFAAVTFELKSAHVAG